MNNQTTSSFLLTVCLLLYSCNNSPNTDTETNPEIEEVQDSTIHDTHTITPDTQKTIEIVDYITKTNMMKNKIILIISAVLFTYSIGIY